jgi:hypothetical protein
MPARIGEASLQLRARAAGAFYLLTFATGGVAAMSGNFVASGDAAATANNILAHEPSFRLGFTAYLLVVACYVVVTALFYDLFKPVNKVVSLLAAFFSLVGCAVQGAACAFLLAPLTLLENAPYLHVFNAEQLQALAYAFLRLYGSAFNIALVFFGFYCLLIGYLIYRSHFLPRVLGGLMMVAGAAWLTFLWPPLAAAVSPYNQVAGAIGEGALTLWLLIAGINAQRWTEQAGAPGSSR